MSAASSPSNSDISFPSLVTSKPSIASTDSGARPPLRKKLVQGDTTLASKVGPLRSHPSGVILDEDSTEKLEKCAFLQETGSNSDRFLSAKKP